MTTTIQNLSDLQDRRIMMDKKLPPYGYAFVILTGLFMIFLVIWSTQTNRIYVSQNSGVVQAANKTYIMSSYSGSITELYVSEGSYVNEGDLIARLKSTDLDMQKDNLQSQLDIYQKQLDQYNKLLNYGYTILRAAVARAIMGSGLFPAFGIFHRNRYNSFPLADDVMEPYRPYVDELVYQLYRNGNTQLTKKVKGELLRLLFVDTRFDKVVRPLEVGLMFSASSLAKCFAGTQKKIAYPLLE